MRRLLPVLVVFGVCGRFVITKPIDDDRPVSPNLKLVVTVDGKSYFADNIGRTWLDAGKFCTDLGMKLADISSELQAEALDQAHSDPDFTGEYWTSGRDVHEKRQFAWNSTGSDIAENYPILSHNSGIPYQTCLVYMSRYNSTSGLKYYPCSEFKGALCNT